MGGLLGMAREHELTALLDKMIQRMHEAEDPDDLRNLSLTVKALQESIKLGLSGESDDPLSGLGAAALDNLTKQEHGTETD